MSNNRITSNIKKWAASHIKDFKFRQHQLEAIESIISGVIGKESTTQIIEAPTGSGKSIICIIAAGVLDECYGKKSYILCSDLYLWSQYEQFIKKNCLDFGCIKGQTGNYECKVNKCDMRNADCRMAKVPFSVLFSNAAASARGFKCAKDCEYVQARKKAVNSNVTMMTYQLFLYQLNRVAGENKPFDCRDVIFCDECHNIPDIVQQQCSPVIKENDITHMVELYRHCRKKQFDLTLFDDVEHFDVIDEYSDEKKLKAKFKKLFDKMLNGSTISELKKSIFEFDRLISLFDDPCERIERDIEELHKQHGIDKDAISLYTHASFYRNYMCFWHDFITAVNDTGGSQFVKNAGMDGEGHRQVTFNCIREDYMVWNYLLRHSPHRVLLSATVGLKEPFDDNIGIKYSGGESTLQRIPSTFNFDKSPVFVLNGIKMSFDKKDESFSKIKPIVYEIVNKHKGQRGMILTGSYENANFLKLSAPVEVGARMLVYSGTKEKSEFMELHKRCKESVIVGPSLNEGVDLPDDQCRFIIIIKVPFPHLKDNLVKAKKEIFPKWYDSKASNSIIQGIGRGIRNSNDYCTTYILDGCFAPLYKRTIQQYPDELQRRMVFY